MKIAFLHTAKVHVATFDHILDQFAPDAQRLHRVDTGLLDRARQSGLDTVRADTLDALQDLSDADAVLCTCSTLGPLADEAARSMPNIVRIDRPLMERACADGESILVALCLESTREATLDLLDDCARQAGCTITPTVVMCSEAWAHFEAGDMESYASAISRAVKAEVAAGTGFDTIVLAQASMRVAEDQLKALGIPVHSSPRLAAERCIEIAKAAVPRGAG